MDFRQFYAAAEVILHGDNPYRNPADPLTHGAARIHTRPCPHCWRRRLTARVGRRRRCAPHGRAGRRCARRSSTYSVSATGVATASRSCGRLSSRRSRRATSRCGSDSRQRSPGGYRDRLVPASASVGVTLAAKFFLWPLVVWLAATRRALSARRRVRRRRSVARRCPGRSSASPASSTIPISCGSSTTPSVRTRTPRTSRGSTSGCRPPSRVRSGSRSAWR